MQRVTEKWREDIAKGVMPSNVVKTFDPKAVEVTSDPNPEVRKASFVVSTASEDRDGDVIEQGGWELGPYIKAGSPVLWAHQATQPPIARAEEIGVAGGRLRAVTVFPEKGVYPFADTIFGLVKGGFIKGTSVGFHPIEAEQRKGKTKGVHFKRMELMEFSILPIPSNRDALLEAKAAGHDVAVVVKWAEALLDQAQGSGLWVPRYQIEKALKSILPLQVTVPALPSAALATGGHASAGAASDLDLKEFADLIAKGDVEGHPFRGNQYTDGSGGGKEEGGGDDGGDRPTLHSSTGARAYDFVRGEERARGMSDEELAYARTDARRAAEAQQGMPASYGGKDQGYYTDEASTYAKEQARRERESRNLDWNKETKLRSTVLGRITEGWGDYVDIDNGISASDARRTIGAAMESVLRGGPGPKAITSHEEANAGMTSQESRRLDSLAQDVWNEVFTSYDAGLDLGKAHSDKVGALATAAERAYRRLVLSHYAKPSKAKKEADMTDAVQKVADELFGAAPVRKAPVWRAPVWKAGAPPWAQKKEDPAPPAGAAPKPGDTGDPEADPADPGEGGEQKPGGDPTEQDPKLGGMLDTLAQTLLAEVQPLKAGGDPTQIATALKTALEKFAAGFMQTYAGAPNPNAASAGATPPPSPPPPPQKTPPPPPPQKGDEADIVKMLGSIDPDELREIIVKATKTSIADTQRHLSGRLPD